MNFHEVNPHHKYQTFKSQTNGDKFHQNCKHYFEINKVGPTTTHWLSACPPNGLKFDVNLSPFVCDLNV